MPTLICPPGSADAGTPISHGDHCFNPYRPDPGGPFLVDVPPEVAAPLIHTGGFVLAKVEEAEPTGEVVLVHHPDPTVSTGAGTADGKGNFWVHFKTAMHLIASHGFKGGARPAEEPAAAASPEPAPKKK